jgi:HAD superfamily hydrolase (TIGR01549 family)
VTAVRLVLFDLDGTLLAADDTFTAAGYARLGLDEEAVLDSGRYEHGVLEAAAALRARLDVEPDDEHLFSSTVARAMGADEPTARRVARAASAAWRDPARFSLYDDVRPVLEAISRAGLAIGFVSNTHRHLETFLAPFAVPHDFALSSLEHGRYKPCPTIFQAACARAGAKVAEAVMVGDSLADDIQGAAVCGMRAILVDRAGRHADAPVERIRSLREVPPLLGVRP